jgi:hypothetical protein
MADGFRNALVRAAVVVVAAVSTSAPAGALAQGRGGGHGGHGGGGTHGGGGGVAIVGGAYGPWAGYGYGYGYGYYGWGPYPPAYYQVEGGIPLSVAMMSGFGGVDLEVKPNRADVWVDGKYAGEARDFDGYPSYLWLKQGVHRVQVYKGGYQTFDEAIEVQPGLKKELKVRLAAGSSTPPGMKPGEKGDAVKEAPKELEKKF